MLAISNRRSTETVARRSQNVVSAFATKDANRGGTGPQNGPGFCKQCKRIVSGSYQVSCSHQAGTPQATGRSDRNRNADTHPCESHGPGTAASECGNRRAMPELHRRSGNSAVPDASMKELAGPAQSSVVRGSAVLRPHQRPAGRNASPVCGH